MASPLPVAVLTRPSFSVGALRRKVNGHGMLRGRIGSMGCTWLIGGILSAGNESSRHFWMDSLRGAAVALVVIFHAFGVPAVFGTPQPEWLGNVFDLLAPYRMPTLLILSGMLLGRSLSKPLPAYTAGKVRSVLWPLLLWTVITLAVAADWKSFSNPWTWIGGAYHLWFLVVLLACYGLGVVCRGVPAWIIPLVMLVCLELGDFSTNVVNRVLWYGAFFFAGAALVRCAAWIQSRGKWLPAIGGVAGAAWSVTFVFADLTPELTVAQFLAPWPGLLGIIWAAPRLPRSGWLEWMGRQSIVLYCAHFPAMILATRLGQAAGASTPAVYALTLLLGFGLPLLLMRFRAQTDLLFVLPRLRFLAAGRMVEPGGTGHS